MEPENRTTMIWFVAGIAAGAGVALLLAPQAGQALRSALGEEMERGGKTILQTGRELYERGREMYERGREIAEDAADMFERARSIAQTNIDERV